MEATEKVHIPIDLCINLNESISKAKIINETMTQRIQKLNQDYRRTVNNYYVDYIDYRKLIELKFEIDPSPKANSMILNSNIFKENEMQFFEMIKFFKNNPAKLAEVLVNSISSERIQKVIDFVFQGMFPAFLNSTCWCQQNLKIYSFMQRAILQEFQSISESKTFVDVSIISDKILKALLKKSETYLFFKDFLLKSAKILMSEETAGNKKDETQKDKNSISERLKLDRRVDNFYGRSKKYKTILEEYFVERGVDFDRFLQDRQEEIYSLSGKYSVGADSIYRRISTCYRMSTPRVRELFTGEMSPNTISFVELLIKSIEKHLPLEVKYFFYLMRIVCDSLGTVYAKTVSMYFIRGILINSSENLEEYFTFEEDKILDRDNIRSVIDEMIPLCVALLDGKYGDGYLSGFIDALTDVPEHIKRIDSEQVGEFKEIVAGQMKDASYAEFMKSQLSGGHGAQTHLPTHEVIHGEHTENLSSRRRSNAAKHKKNKSVIFTNNSGIIKRELKELNKDFYKYCNFHTETCCIALAELAEMVDLYNLTRESNDSSMSLDLYNNLSSILKNSETENLKSAIDKNIFIIFYENITNPEKNKKISKQNTYGNVVNILSNEFVSREILERFSGRTFRDLVNYGLHNWMFDDSSQFESKNEFANYKYDMSLKNIHIAKRPHIDSLTASVWGKHKNKDSKPKSAPVSILKPPEINQSKSSPVLPTSFELTEQLNNAIYYYNAFDSDITIKNYQLGSKKHEIFSATNESHKYKEFRKAIIEIKVCRDFDKLMKEFNLDICITSDVIMAQKQVSANYVCVRATNCPYTSSCINWALLCDSNTGALLNKDFFGEKQHFHFEKIHEIVQFLNLARIPREFVEQNRHGTFLQVLIQGMIRMYEQNIEKTVERDLLNEYKKLAGKEQTINGLFNNFISSKLNSQLFPQNLTFLDDGFKLNCEVIGFLELKEFGKIKNWEKVQLSLESPIKKINKISSILSYDSIMSTLQVIMQKITGVVSAINNCDTGADDLIPTLIYCIIQAKPANFISMFKFIDLFTRSSESKGKQGFIVTQIEISIKTIEDWAARNLTSKQSLQLILKREIENGIHFLRIRKRNQAVARIVGDTDSVLI